MRYEFSPKGFPEQKGDKNAALSTLAKIDSAASRSAAFMIVSHHEGGDKLLDWLEKSGIKVMSLDAEGKYFLLTQLLDLGRWEEARENLDKLDDQDLEDVLRKYCFMFSVVDFVFV